MGIKVLLQELLSTSTFLTLAKPPSHLDFAIAFPLVIMLLSVPSDALFSTSSHWEEHSSGPVPPLFQTLCGSSPTWVKSQLLTVLQCPVASTSPFLWPLSALAQTWGPSWCRLNTAFCPDALPLGVCLAHSFTAQYFSAQVTQVSPGHPVSIPTSPLLSFDFP